MQEKYKYRMIPTFIQCNKKKFNSFLLPVLHTVSQCLNQNLIISIPLLTPELWRKCIQLITSCRLRGAEVKMNSHLALQKKYEKSMFILFPSVTRKSARQEKRCQYLNLFRACLQISKLTAFQIVSRSINSSCLSSSTTVGLSTVDLGLF